ncbi:unnamed protein product [Miscanthus lutarioriparius]|uniref:Uncharacterized protein n=1 Tax=Miscanthus lutarioriparius TaxID=422564 RepID=A0A811NMW5_9POAL|nr:unnamed protein product [Miscanthus lutarioriparius]
MMRDLTCFGETSVQIADASSSSSSSGTGASGRGKGKGIGGGASAARSRRRVTCLYHARLAGQPCAVSVTWTRGGGGLVGRQAAALGVVVAVGCTSGDHRLWRADVRPWLFSKRSRGSKTLDVAATAAAAGGGGAGKVDVFWDLSGARFGAGPEPLEGFYVAVVCGLEMVLLLGDMRKEAYRRTGAGRPAPDVDNALLVARREHVVGRKVYSARAQFCHGGPCHDVVIECDIDTAVAGVVSRDPCLEIRVDRRPVVQVKRLPWKFRGNQIILVDGLPVKVFWDVHGWLFGSVTADAVFMFRTCQAEPEKSVTWAYSQIFREPQLQGHHGFSLIIHAWKVE